MLPVDEIITENTDKERLPYIPDFISLVKAYKAQGMRITKEEDIEQAFQYAESYREGPTLLEFIIDTEINVLPMVPAGQSLQEMVLVDA